MSSEDSTRTSATGSDSAAASRESFARRLVGPALLFVALAAVLLISLLLYRVEAGRIQGQQMQRETTRVNLLAELMRSELRPGINDVRYLADGDALHDFLDTGSKASLDAAIRRARFASLSHPEYDQLRYLDEDGNEILRVDQGGRVIAAANLQNKRNSPYFQRASTLQQGWVYVTEFDLTIENGEIVTPFKPVVRFAVPVFDRKNRRRGIYVISMLGGGLIERLEHAIGTEGQRLRVLDDAGNWLKAANPAREWGASLAGRAQFALPQVNPALWERMRHNHAGQSITQGGLFTWQWLLPESYSTATEGRLVADNAYFIVAMELTPSEWSGLLAGLRHIMYVATPALLLFTLFTAWLIRMRHKVLVNLRNLNLALERRVRERTAALARSNEELLQREALLGETGRLAKVGGWEFDPATGEGNWTPEIAAIHDLPVTLKATKDLGLQFFAGESRARLEAALKQSLADGKPYDLELEMTTARGVHKWVRTISRPEVHNGRVVRMRGALQDITDRKLVELNVQMQLQRLQLLERSTRAIGERQDLASILQVVVRTLEEQLALDFCCVCLYDETTRELVVTAIGAASSLVAGELNIGEAARIPVGEHGLARCVRGELVHAGDISTIDAPFAQRLATIGLRDMVAAPLQVESRVFGVLIAARRAAHSFDGTDCEFLRQLSEHVALAAHQAQLHDALKAAYEDLRNTQQAVMQQERLRVLGQMASGIAHDINNAISPIMLYTDALLEREPDLSAPARQKLQTIQQAVSDVAETVARMREFYREREAQTELRPVQMNTLILQLPDLTRARWETMPQQRGIVVDLRLELSESLPPALGIENEIREALINLIFNAVDAMPDGGRIVVRTGVGAAGGICVDVIDTGTGMDEETRRRCLEPFFTTKGEQGTGLGLAMVYGVMQRHGGEVEIDSSPGRGTTMRLTFARAETADIHAYEPEVTPPTGLSLLLVDDDPILLRSLREILEMDQHRVVVADSGQGGINLFRASLEPGGEPFSAVITDLGMPHVDGRAVAATVKQLAPATPVILLTGWGERLLAAGHTVPHVDRVLSKPPRLRDLRKALAQLTIAHG